MADYNRFISYIYLYERGMKTINTGFAKVESRGPQCRIDIMMKNMYHESHVKFNTYMFVRKKGVLLGIYLGKLKTESSIGEFHGMADAGNIEKSGYSLEQIAGMIIRGDNGKIYGTGWDDEILHVEHFVPVDEYDEHEILKTDDPPLQDGEANVSESEETLPESEESLSELEEVLPEPEEDLPESEDGIWDSMKNNTEEPSLHAEEMCEMQAVICEKCRGEQKGQDNMERLFEKGLRMFPFEDGEISECIRMEPQDIGNLPMKYWFFANNSFLLHGYYSYRHLILARMKDGKCILGIPGVNYSREQFMAGMFGFDYFKPVRAHVPESCEFGYWYTVLE